MNCTKCSGLMTYEGFYGSESNSVWYYPGWRCVHCGDIVDNVVALNRQLNNGASHHERHHDDERPHAYAHGCEKGHRNSYAAKSESIKRFFLKRVGVRDEGTSDDEYASQMEGSHDDFAF